MIYKIILFGGMLFSVGAQFFVKAAMKRIGLVQLNVSFLDKLKQMAGSPYLWLALVCYAISFMTYAIVLSKVELNRAFPVTIIAATILVFIVSVVFYHESVNFNKVFGLILCLTGVIFLLR